MSKRKGKASYSAGQRRLYHEKRANSPEVSENKKLYSRNELDGFPDSHAESNYSAVKSEIVSRKRNKASHSSYNIMLHSYKNGLSAKLKK